VKQQFVGTYQNAGGRMSMKEILRTQASRTDEFGEIKADTLLTIARTPMTSGLLSPAGRARIQSMCRVLATRAR
jgi:hypothetical protein